MKLAQSSRMSSGWRLNCWPGSDTIVVMAEKPCDHFTYNFASVTACRWTFWCVEIQIILTLSVHNFVHATWHEPKCAPHQMASYLIWSDMLLSFDLYYEWQIFSVMSPQSRKIMDNEINMRNSAVGEISLKEVLFVCGEIQFYVLVIEKGLWWDDDLKWQTVLIISQT